MARRRSGSVTVYNGRRGKTFGIRYRDAGRPARQRDARL